MNVSSSGSRSGQQAVTDEAVSSERQTLEELVTSLMLHIQEKEAKLLLVSQENEAHQSTIRSIRQEKDDTIKQRKRVDVHLQSWNNEITDKREVLVRLQGNLQYRKEEKINEAIRRLEYQLSANNYRVTEEIKIVQEIDRLKRSKKSLCQYLALKEELDRTKDKLHGMRNERDALYRRVSGFKSAEEEIKNKIRDNRFLMETLKKEVDELYVGKRKAIADLKQASQPLLHLKELHQPVQRRTQSFTKKCRSEDNSKQQVAVTPQKQSSLPSPPPSFNETSSRIAYQDDVSPRTHFLRKGRLKQSPVLDDPHSSQLRLCNTLCAYLLRLTVTPATTPATPVVEHRTSPERVHLVDDSVTVLHRHDECDDMFGGLSRKGRGLKKNKRKCQPKKALSHTPEVLHQFSLLGLKPPSIVGDVPACLDALAAKKECFASEKQTTPTKEVESAVPGYCHGEPVSRKEANSSSKTDSPASQCDDVTPATENAKSSAELVQDPPVSVPMTNHFDDSNICDKTVGNNWQLATSSLSVPDIIVTHCGDAYAETMPSDIELKCSRNLDTESDSSFLPKVCNGVLTNGDDKLVH